jgi:hypothetical protein
MTFIRNRRVTAALVATSCLALTASASADSLPSTYESDAAQSGYARTLTAASASADSLPSTYKSDAAQSGYAGTLTASASEDSLPSTYKSEAAQADYSGTPVDQPGSTRAATAQPTTIEVVRPERTIVRDVDEPLPLILSSTALLFGLAGLGVVLIRTRTAPRAGH